MTDAQKQQCPDLYRRLLKATLQPGQSAWFQGVEVRKWTAQPTRAKAVA